MTTPLREEVLNLYSKDQLRDIAHYGCISGCATHHITYQQTCDFYDQWEDQIMEELELVIENPLQVASNKAETLDQIKNTLCWMALEVIAQSELDE